MKRLTLSLLLVAVAALFCQEIDFAKLTGKYLGQTKPGTIPELFAPGLVSVGEGVHGNIVFNADFSEAAWHPNYLVDGKALIYIMTYRQGHWQPPIPFFFKDGVNYSEPFYSQDAKKLYFLSGKRNQSGIYENEKIYVVERDGDRWSDARLIDPIFESLSSHWQFSLNKNGDLYFGASHPVPQGKSDIQCARFQNGKYLPPTPLSGAVNSDLAEFAPFVSADDDYLIFTRSNVGPRGSGRPDAAGRPEPPFMKLFVSFKDKNGNWTEAQDLSAKIEWVDKPEMVFMNQARVTPDGKYLFFTLMTPSGNMAYWVDARLIDALRPIE